MNLIMHILDRISLQIENEKSMEIKLEIRSR